ncbi:hypothetical protein M422DRAFT_243923 [Sphaerobolus stellatus SS14]|nr:hypothetical protein M422DRAFT_243923 [Sphaerobolus stellatus SS14]
MFTFRHGSPLISGLPPPPSSPGAIAEGILHLRAVSYLGVATLVMLAYDHLLTFDQEVNRIWKRTFSGASLLFLLNRYISLLQGILSIIWILTPIVSNNKYLPFPTSRRYCLYLSLPL